MSGKHNRKIINFSVKRQLQMRLFIKVLGVALIGIGLMAAIFYFYSNREIEGSFKMFHVHAKNFLDYLWPAVGFSVLAAVLLAAGITLFFPLKIAGPLFRIERILKEQVANGDLSVRLKLRDGDEVGDLAEALNTTLEEVGAKIRSVTETAKILESSLGEQDSNIKELTAELNEDLRWFKLKAQ